MNAERLNQKLKIYGADIDGIEDRFMGDADLYEMCLADFLCDVNFNKLNAASASSDYKGAFEAAHALKGLSGNLGLTRFYEAICALVEDLRVRDYSDYDAKHDRVNRELEFVQRVFKDGDKPPEPPQGPTPPEPPVSEDIPEDSPSSDEGRFPPGESWETGDNDAQPALQPPRLTVGAQDSSPVVFPPGLDSARAPAPITAGARGSSHSRRARLIKKKVGELKKNLDEKGPNVFLIGAGLALVVLFVVFLFINTIDNYNKNNAAANAGHLQEICYQLKLYVEENMDNNWKVANSIAASIVKGAVGDRRELFDLMSAQRDIWDVTDVTLYTENGLGVNSRGEVSANDVVSQTIYETKKNGENLRVVDSELIYTIPVQTELTLDNSRIAAVSISHDMWTFLDNMRFSSFDGNAVIYLTQNNGAIISALTHRFAVNAYNIKAVLNDMNVRFINGKGVDAEYLFTQSEPEVYLIDSPWGVDYVVCAPISVHHSGLRLFYVVGESLVNEVSRSFSSFITLLSSVLVAVVLAGTMFIFLSFYNARKRRFDEELLSREHMYDLLAKNTQTAFGFYREGRPEPVYTSKNVKNVIGRDRFLLNESEGRLSMSLPDGSQSDDLRRINAALRDWNGKGPLMSGYIRKPDSSEPSFYELRIFAASDVRGEYVCIAQNATKAYERENALKEALGMAESANQAKSRFLSNMSHDIRTPMNAIVNMTNFAIDSMDNPKRLSEYLYTIRKSSDHLLGLINDVLTMSRIDSGKTSLTEEPFDLVELLDKVSDIVRPLCKSKSLTFITDFSNISATALSGDHVKLSQILMNLLSNAVKYTPNNGAVRFSVEQPPSLADDMVDLRFIVEDNGIGIPKRFLEKIFEPFSRVDNKRTSGIEGSGLGLSICHSYITAMGGKMSCESEEGNGSTFVAELFFKKASRAPKPLESIPERVETPFLGKHCLICEDNATNLTIAKTMLERLGFLVDDATDGWEGVSMFKRSKPGQYDVIYMDIQMPIMDGYEATVAIRESEHSQARTVPIIAMTANVFAEDIEKARIAGMDGHVGKPIFTIDLVRETDRVLNRKGEGDT